MKPKLKTRLKLDLTKLSKEKYDGNENSEPKHGNGLNLDEELCVEEYLSERKLMEATGEEDLSKVVYLELLVNTTSSTLSRLGEKLPSLKQLKLNGSVLPTVRDLGTSMRDIEVLWLSRVSLNDLSGISVFDKVKELYLSYNEIDDISQLSQLENLEILDLESNGINDLDMMWYLKDCENLISLNLSNNPCSSTHNVFQRNKYLEKVKEVLPKLELLDEYPVDHAYNQQKKPVLTKEQKKDYEKESKMLDDEVKFLHSSIKYTKIEENEELVNNPKIICKLPQFFPKDEREEFINTKRPLTARFFVRPKRRSSVSSSYSFNRRPMSARPKSELYYYHNVFMSSAGDEKEGKKKEKRSLRKDFDVTKLDNDDDFLQLIIKHKFQKKLKRENEMRSSLSLKKRKSFKDLMNGDDEEVMENTIKKKNLRRKLSKGKLKKKKRKKGLRPLKGKKKREKTRKKKKTEQKIM